MSDVIFQTDIRDWRIDAGEEKSVPAEQRQEYTLSLIRVSKTQFCLEIKPKNGDESPAIESFIEINSGLPCMHLSHELFGDNCLHAFGTVKGIAVVPENSADCENFDSRHVYPNSPSEPATLYR